jgi:hypothetical protein
MTKKNGTSKASTKRDPLAPYREQARTFINLYFNDNTPDFVRDVLTSWLTNLESQTQVFWNHRDILEVALPLMLEKADRMGVDVEDRHSEFCLESLYDSLGLNDEEGRFKPEMRERTIEEKLQEELARDGEAIARLLKSSHTPANVRDALSDALADVIASADSDSPEFLKTVYPLAVLQPVQSV